VNSQGNTQQKEQCLRYQNTQFQTILQSHSNKKKHGSGIKMGMKTSGTE
jgi:hypothetical protein